MRKSEFEVYEKYEALGYDIIKVGIPDLILLKDGNIEFVEVKTELNPHLAESQKRTIKILEKHSIPVKVEIVEVRDNRRNSRSLYSYPLNAPYYTARKSPKFPSWLFTP